MDVAYIICIFSAKPTKDDPWAWEAREFLRKKLVGKEVFFTADKSANSTREIGCIYLGKDMSNCENLTEVLIAEGYVSVRKDAKNDDYFLNLKRLEEIAKSQGKGIHGANSKVSYIFVIIILNRAV